MNSKPTSVNEYIQASPKIAQLKLNEMRNCIRAAAPDAIEGLKYGVPAFSYKTTLVAYAAFKHHIGFYPTPSAMNAFKKKLTPYKTSTGSIQFPLSEPLPIKLISDITAFRVKESKELDDKGKV